MKPILGMAAIALLLNMAGCKKGDVGPEGPRGEQGERGDQGPQGVAGNTSYREFAFNNVTVAAGINQTANRDLALSRQDFERSAILIYVYLASNQTWSVLPGEARYQTFAVSYFFPGSSGDITRLSILRTGYRAPHASGSESITFNQLKVIVMPLGQVSALQTSGVSLSDYERVSAFLEGQ